MNETIKNLLERRSVRGYKEDLVPEEVLNEILEAGEYAPSGMGQQGTLMVVTQNPELVAKLSKMNADVMGTREFDSWISEKSTCRSHKTCFFCVKFLVFIYCILLQCVVKYNKGGILHASYYIEI